MEFSPDKIKKVAQLAKIKLSEEQVILFNEQFKSIAEIITKLQLINTNGIPPIHNPLQSSALMREDVVKKENEAEDILSNAPTSAFNCFVVPKVVE
jgi:aspartyl-tRNA(Asn)/glutamyl-tRNA(Gln) amidotransferase subunit C